MFPNQKDSYTLQNTDHSDDMDEMITSHSFPSDSLSKLDEGHLDSLHGSSLHLRPHSSMEMQFCRTRQKLRNIYHMQILIFIGIVMVGVLICTGLGFLFILSVSARNDVRTLVIRVDSLEETVSSLRNGIDTAIEQNDDAVAGKVTGPVAMRNFMPSHLWEQVMKKKSGKTKAKKPPSPVMSTGSLGRYLMGKLNQTVSGLDRDNKMMLTKLTILLQELKRDNAFRESKMDRLFVETSYKLQELRVSTDEITNKLEKSEKDTKVNTILKLVKELDDNQTAITISTSVILKKMDAVANESLMKFERSLAREMIKIHQTLQESSINETNKTDICDSLDKELKSIDTDIQTIDKTTDVIKTDVESIHVTIESIIEKFDLVSASQNRTATHQNNLNDILDAIKVKTDKIDKWLIETEEEHKELTNIMIGNITGIDLNIRQLEALLDTHFMHDSELRDKTYRDESLSFDFSDTSMRKFQMLLQEEFKNAIKMLKAITKGESASLSSTVIKEIRERFGRGLQTIESLMRNDSASISSTDMREIQRLIEEQFGSGLKVLEKTLTNKRSSQLSRIFRTGNNSKHNNETTPVTSDVCLPYDGCTPVKYASRRCFKVFQASQDESSWLQAKRKCQKLGGYLAEVVNAREYDILIKSLPAYGNYWLGGTDRGSEGYWHWEHSLQRISLSGWAPGQPDNRKYVEHCLHLLHNELTVWNDIRCTMKMGYICEKQNTSCDDWE